MMESASECSRGPLIHIIDDDPPFRTALARVLQSAGYRVTQYSSSEQALNTIVGSERGCILLDVRMDGLSGPELHEELLASGCDLPVVFLTGYGDLPTSVRAIKAGAEDFLSKPVPRDTLVQVIERALARFDREHEQHSQIRALRSLVSKLTPREREVFELVVRGKLNKQIAHQLGAAERTIKAHRHNIMFKLGVKSVAELVSIAETLRLQPTHELSRNLPQPGVNAAR
jgi:FixJ family two-component response regulator